jgi:hypothetical protein
MYGMLTLTLLGLVSLDAYETRRGNQTLSMQVSEPLKNKEGEFCHSRAATVRLQSPWLFRHN